MQPRVGVGILVFKEGKFLLGWRKSSHGANTWSLPGGHLEFGESPEQAAIREVREETGIEIKNPRFGALTNDVFKDDNKHYLTVWIIGDWKSGEPVSMEPDKTVDFQWFDFDSLPEPLFPTWNQLLKSQFLVSLKRQLADSKN